MNSFNSFWNSGMTSSMNWTRAWRHCPFLKSPMDWTHSWRTAFLWLRRRFCLVGPFWIVCVQVRPGIVVWLFSFSIMWGNVFFVDFCRSCSLYNWLRDFLQHAFDVFRFSFSWTAESRMISCTFDASRLTIAKAFCMTVTLAIDALRDFAFYAWRLEFNSITKHMCCLVNVLVVVFRF